MTLDQIIFMLTTQGSKRKKDVEMDSAQTLAMSDKYGQIKGRDADGNPIKAVWHGKSLAERVRDGEVTSLPKDDGNKEYPGGAPSE